MSWRLLQERAPSRCCESAKHWNALSSEEQRVGRCVGCSQVRKVGVKDGAGGTSLCRGSGALYVNLLVVAHVYRWLPRPAPKMLKVTLLCGDMQPAKMSELQGCIGLRVQNLNRTIALLGPVVLQN